MILGEEFDPDMAGLAAGASVLGKLSGPSPTPVRMGSILGQLGGAMYGAKQNAVLQGERIANDRMLRNAQQEELKAKLAERQDKALRLQKFNSILGESENPQDPVTILVAGVKSGAFGPQEITSFMGSVMQKQAALEAKVETERTRLQDRQLAREEREASERRMAELRATLQQDNIKLAAAFRPQPQEPLVPVEQPDGTVVYTPRSQAAGKAVPPPRRDARGLPPTAIKELGEKGEAATNFIRLSGTFKDEFGGKGSAIVGDAQNLIGRNLGMGKSEQADWWQDYQMQKNLIRNKLFGSALTASEASEFDKAAITPGMKPDIIRLNLARQKAAAVRAAKKLASAYKTGGYNEQQIFEALGISQEELAGADAKDPWE